MSDGRKITRTELLKLLRYDDVSGLFFWKKRGLRWFESEVFQKSWNTKYSGKIAGSKWKDPKSGKAYWQITILNHKYTAHRVAMKMTFGESNSGVDHRDGDGLNNKLENLRYCNQSENIANSKLSKANSTGVKGVTLCKRTNKYHAQIRVKGKNLFLGRFAILADAGQAYKSAAKKHFGEFSKC